MLIDTRSLPGIQLHDWKSWTIQARIWTQEGLLKLRNVLSDYRVEFLHPVLSSSLSLQHSLLHAVGGFLFPNTIKRKVWKWTVQVLAPIGNIYYYTCFPKTWTRNGIRRRILLWAEPLHPGLPRLMFRTFCFGVYFIRNIGYGCLVFLLFCFVFAFITTCFLYVIKHSTLDRSSIEFFKFNSCQIIWKLPLRAMQMVFHEMLPLL